MKRIGLALGGGGVRGLTHILILELLDELGFEPCVIAGSSMGAVVGALYASGLSAREIKKRVRKHIVTKNDSWKDVVQKKVHFLRLLDTFRPQMGRGGLFMADRFLNSLFTDVRKVRFDELDIPLFVVAADYWKAQEVVIKTGDVLPAITASMAVPGVFAPVSLGGNLLVDGGVVNLVPYDHIMGRCDISIAVDVGRARSANKHELPNVLESILGTFDIMQQATLTQKMQYLQPDIYIKPEIHNVRMFDFGKVEEVFRQAKPAVEKLRTELGKRTVEPLNRARR